MMTEFLMKSADGLDIHVFSLADAASVSKPSGVVQIVHGMAEHAQWYEDFGRYLNSKGYFVYAADQRAHGKTAGAADYGYYGTDGFSRCVDDEIALTALIREKHPGLPVILLGHSNGSFMSQEYALRAGDKIDAMIQTGPAVFFAKKRLLTVSTQIARAIKLVRGGRYKSKFLDKLAFGKYTARIPDARTYYDWISSDPAVVDAYMADDFCGGIFSVNFYIGFAKGLLAIADKKRIMNIRKSLPILLAAGKEDPVGAYGTLPPMLADAYREAGVEDVELKLYDGMRHEILNEVGKAMVYADISDWIAKHIK